MQCCLAFVYRVMVGSSWAPTAILDSSQAVESEFVSVESLVAAGASMCLCLCALAAGTWSWKERCWAVEGARLKPRCHILLLIAAVPEPVTSGCSSLRPYEMGGTHDVSKPSSRYASNLSFPSLTSWCVWIYASVCGFSRLWFVAELQWYLHRTGHHAACSVSPCGDAGVMCCAQSRLAVEPVSLLGLWKQIGTSPVYDVRESLPQYYTLPCC